MRVTGAGPANAVGARSSPRPASEGFASPAAEEAGASATAARAGALGAVSSLDALLALQETLGPQERRRRATRRAGRILDALDALKLTLLGDAGAGGGDTPALEQLHTAVDELRNETDDPGLEDLLEQVEIRAAVELAKREMARPVRTRANPSHGESGANLT